MNYLRDRKDVATKVSVVTRSVRELGPIRLLATTTHLVRERIELQKILLRGLA
jgi:hypothetical protein